MLKFAVFLQWGRAACKTQQTALNYCTLNQTINNIVNIPNQPMRMLYLQQYLKTLSPQDRARLDSCIGNGEDASAWLEAIPYCKDLEMSDTAFGIALKFRLGAAFTEIDESLPVEQLKCIGRNCKRIIEGSANHFCGGCAYGNHPTNTHNSVVQALKEIVSSAGRIVKKATQIEVDSNKYPLNRDHVGITGQAPTCNWCHPCIKRCTLYRSFKLTL